MKLTLRTLALGFIGVTMSAPFSAYAQADCSSATADAHMDWCSRDHGFNEGATCGASALSGVGLSGVPALVPQPILGNTWDRTNMIALAKTAYKAGQQEKAIDAVVCCQVHNGGAHQCLQSHRDRVAAWLGR
jgi:hypothetical protein